MFTGMGPKSVLPGIALFGCFTIVGAQQQPAVVDKQSVSSEKRALIAELLEVTGSRKSALQVYQAMLDQQEKMMPDLVKESVASNAEFQRLTEEQREELRKKLVENSNRTSKRVKELFEERIDFSKIVEDISYELYDKYYTEDELKDLVGFYRTPTGKKTIAVMPTMFSESMTMTMERIKPQMSEIMTTLTKEESERVSKELETFKTKQPANRKPVRRRRKSA
jgi:hypothetical protein